MSLKRVLLFSLCILVLSGLVGCREKEITDKSVIDDEKEYMRLYFNDTEIPVIWEDMDSIPYALFLYLISGKMQSFLKKRFMRKESGSTDACTAGK